MRFLISLNAYAIIYAESSSSSYIEIIYWNLFPWSQPSCEFRNFSIYWGIPRSFTNSQEYLNIYLFSDLQSHSMLTHLHRIIYTFNPRPPTPLSLAIRFAFISCGLSFYFIIFLLLCSLLYNNLLLFLQKRRTLYVL